jgi:hypothetical protein
VRFLGAVLLSGLLTAPLAAQAPGLPVMNSGLLRGVTLAGMAGFPNSVAGNGTPLAASLTIGARRVGVQGFVSRMKQGTGTGQYSGGGNLIIKLAGGPLVPVSINLQGGAAYTRQQVQPGQSGAASGTVNTIHAPVGLSLAWTIARPVVAIKPWVAPRLDLTRVDSNGLVTDGTTSDFGLSGGLSFGFLNGINLDVAVDRVFTKGLAVKPTTVGAGVSFTIK